MLRLSISQELTYQVTSILVELVESLDRSTNTSYATYEAKSNKDKAIHLIL